MEKFCIMVNKDRDEKLELTQKVQEYLRAQGKQFTVRMESLTDVTEFEPVPPDTDCVLVLGGDGTMIRAANRLKASEIPMLGINSGTLGYLTGVERNETENGILALCAGKYRIENRMMLDVEKDGCYSDTVLNEVAITRSGVSRVINVAVYVNDSLLDVISGDGLLISTPTGSTGYNMSAGGAIVKPEAELMMITPLCPHSLSSRPVIVTAEDEIRIEVIQDRRTQDVEVTATYDGREAVQVKAGESLTIRKSNYVTRLMKLDERSFFEVLRSKLGRTRHEERM